AAARLRTAATRESILSRWLWHGAGPDFPAELSRLHHRLSVEYSLSQPRVAIGLRPRSANVARIPIQLQAAGEPDPRGRAECGGRVAAGSRAVRRGDQATCPRRTDARCRAENERARRRHGF